MGLKCRCFGVGSRSHLDVVRLLTRRPCAEREVKKANRELHSQTARMSEIQKIDHLTKRCSDLLADMKRHERDNIKNKKRADQLQKEKDHVRSELTKQNGLKEKLEKLCRELQKENNKLKVSICHNPCLECDTMTRAGLTAVAP